MLSNSDLIDNVNPYILDPPGAWSKPYEFGQYKELPDSPPEFNVQDKSPACSTMTTAGDKQLEWCQPRKPNCPMSRELEPTQRVDPDISYEDGVFVPVSEKTYILHSKSDPKIMFKILLILFIIIILLTLAEKL